MGRREKMLDGIAVADLIGVEIGALDKPLVRKSDGTVYYVDHCDTDTLKTRWKDDTGVNNDALWVDAVWGKSSLGEALSSGHAPNNEVWSGADYVVASHVIEHVPDLVSWLREIGEILRPGGTVRLAIPDKRYCFDYLRKPSTFADVVSEFIRKRRVPGANRILDCTLNMATVDCGKAWRGQIVDSELERVYGVKDAIAIAIDAEVNGAYHDVHCWAFTPDSFAELMHDLAQAELLSFKCEWMVQTLWDDLEFFTCMSDVKDCAEAAASWKVASGNLGPSPQGP